MMKLNAKQLHFQDLNKQIREIEDTKITIEECMGQRYIGSGLEGKEIYIHGIPGNALGAYLAGSNIHAFGNVQDATGDTMNDGAIYIHGMAGDATGYGMRGGKIFVKEDVGYRAGIHMKAYKDKQPILIIGGKAGSFLGEYQAGGNIVVLGLHEENKPPVGYFCGTGMHGGKIFLRTEQLPTDLPKQVVAKKATEEDMQLIKKDLEEFCSYFDLPMDMVYEKSFYVLTPDTKNPYKQLYTHH